MPAKPLGTTMRPYTGNLCCCCTTLAFLPSEPSALGRFCTLGATSLCLEVPSRHHSCAWCYPLRRARCMYPPAKRSSCCLPFCWLKRFLFCLAGRLQRANGRRGCSGGTQGRLGHAAKVRAPPHAPGMRHVIPSSLWDIPWDIPHGMWFFVLGGVWVVPFPIVGQIPSALCCIQYQ